MGQDNLNQIKNILGDHITAIDNDALWAGIATKQAQSRKRRFVYYLAGLIIILLGVLGVVYLNNTGKSSQLVESNISTENIKSNQASEQRPGQELSTIQNSDNSSTENNNKPSSITEGLNESNDNLITASALESSAALSDQASSSHSQIDISPSSLSNHLADNSSIETNNKTTIESSIKASESIEYNPNVIIRENISYPSLNHLGMLPLTSLSGNTERNFKAPLISKRSNIECYNYGKKKIPVYLEIYTGLDFVDPAYNASFENQGYLDERKASQSVKLSYNAGAQLKFLFDNGLYLKAGVDYSQYKERFKYNKTTTIDTILPNQLIEINILPNGDTSWVYGNAPATIIESKNWRVGNDYREVGISALAGYQLERNKSFIGIESGVLYNLWFDFNGMLLNPSNNPVMVNDYFKSRNNLSILASLKYGYRVNDRIALLAGLNYRSNLSDINSTKNLVNQRNRRIGMSAGVEFKLW
ncbi:MAG: hypothetical protein HKN09_08740 [Saprospiraceae bacterium]|nr:hypothetical protein [Saprospiraceae bacterium]